MKSLKKEFTTLATGSRQFSSKSWARNRYTSSVYKYDKIISVLLFCQERYWIHLLSNPLYQMMTNYETWFTEYMRYEFDSALMH